MHPAGQIHRHPQAGCAVGRGDDRVGRGTQFTGCPDPDDAVEDEVGLAHENFQIRDRVQWPNLSTGTTQRLGASWVEPVRLQRHRHHTGTPTGQMSTGQQRVPAVGTGADQDDHVRAVRPRQPLPAVRREPESGSIHQRGVGNRAHQRLLGRSHRGDFVQADHQYKPITSSKPITHPYRPITRTTPSALRLRTGATRSLRFALGDDDR